MSTIVRVKRRLEDNPAGALVLHCKRAKISNSVPSVFIFSGTTSEKENENVTIKKTIISEKNKQNIDGKKDISALLQKLKDEKDSANYDKKLKIINLSRGISINTDKSEKEDENNFSLLDLHNCSGDDNVEQKFAYDIYISNKHNIEISDVVDIEGIHPLYNDVLMFDSNDNYNDDNDDDEDSNCENNWRNEYPDTEDDSVEEDDMIRAVQNLAIGNELSSDDDDELAYGYSSSANPVINKDDVEKYGLGYAKYKLKVLIENNESDTKLPQLIHYDDSRVQEEDLYFYPKHDDDEVDIDKSRNSDSESDGGSVSNSLSDFEDKFE